MLIGELAERAGTSTRTLRYYEPHGLVRPRRSANGYRLYDEAELRVVQEIRALLAWASGWTTSGRSSPACARATTPAMSARTRWPCCAARSPRSTTTSTGSARPSTVPRPSSRTPSRTGDHAPGNGVGSLIPSPTTPSPSGTGRERRSWWTSGPSGARPARFSSGSSPSWQTSSATGSSWPSSTPTTTRRSRGRTASCRCRRCWCFAGRGRRLIVGSRPKAYLRQTLTAHAGR